MTPAELKKRLAEAEAALESEEPVGEVAVALLVTLIQHEIDKIEMWGELVKRQQGGLGH